MYGKGGGWLRLNPEELAGPAVLVTYYLVYKFNFDI